MINNFYNLSLPNIAKTIFTVMFSLLFYIVLRLLGMGPEKSGLLYQFASIFMIWTILECIVKKDIFYLIFIWLIAFPFYQWFVNRSMDHLSFRIFGIIINYNCVFIIVLFSNLLKNKDYKLAMADYKTNTAFFGCLVVAIISIAYTSNRNVAINSILYAFIIPYVVLIIIINILEKSEDVIKLLKIIFYALLFHNIQTLFLQSAGLIHKAFATERYQGVFGNPNIYANIVLYSALTSFFFIFYYSQRRIFYILSLGLSVFMLVMSGSRGVLLCFILSILFFAICLRSSKKVIWIFFVIGLCFVTFMTVDKSIIQQLFIKTSVGLRFYNQGIDSERFFLWQQCITLIKEKVLIFKGLGAGVLFYDTTLGKSTAHSLFLTLAISIGLIGSALYHYIIIRNINLKLMFSKRSLYGSFPSIIIFSSIFFMNVVGARFVGYREINNNLINISTSMEIVLLWIFMGVSIVVGKREICPKYGAKGDPEQWKCRE